jgi:hypothetical protein
VDRVSEMELGRGWGLRVVVGEWEWWSLCSGSIECRSGRDGILLVERRHEMESRADCVMYGGAAFERYLPMALVVCMGPWSTQVKEM